MLKMPQESAPNNGTEVTLDLSALTFPTVDDADSSSHTSPEEPTPMMFLDLANSLSHVELMDSLAPKDWHTQLVRAHEVGSADHIHDALRTVVKVLGPLRLAAEEQSLLDVTKLLADGSRYSMYIPYRVFHHHLSVILRAYVYSESWRLSYGESGVLDYYLKLVAKEEIYRVWYSDGLRIIANTCADTGKSY